MVEYFPGIAILAEMDKASYFIKKEKRGCLRFSFFMQFKTRFRAAPEYCGQTGA